MSSDTPTKAELAIGVLLNFPDTVRRAIVSDEQFARGIGVEQSSIISFPGHAAFRRSEFHATLSRAMNGSAEIVSICDEESKVWRVSVEEASEEVVAHVMRENTCLVVPAVELLSQEWEKRSAGFQRIATAVNLHGAARLGWQGRIDRAALDEIQFSQFARVLNLTPSRVADRITHALRHNSVDLEDLVPTELAYYEQLVGEAEAGLDLFKYAQESGKAHIDRLLAWNPGEGFRLALLTSSHSLLTRQIGIAALDRELVLESYQWLEAHGDTLSQVGAIEAAIPAFSEIPELVPWVERLAETLRIDATDRFSLASALFVMVSGYVGRRQVFRGMPVFWERLACLAHASLLERLVLASNLDASSFAKWAQAQEERWFDLHCLARLPQAPRWLPDFASPAQLNAEYFGRLSMAAEVFADSVTSSKLRDWLLSSEPGSIKASVGFLEQRLPGPLEGATRSSLSAPKEVLDDISRKLDGKVILPETFAGLVNTALVFNAADIHIGMAVELLRNADYRIEGSDQSTGTEALALVVGLAFVAGVTRSAELAQAVRVLCRVTRRRYAGALPIFQEFRASLIAGSAFEDMASWSTFVGDWLTELAFETDAEQGAILSYNLDILLKLAPTLRRAAARGVAALATL